MAAKRDNSGDLVHLDWRDWGRSSDRAVQFNVSHFWSNLKGREGGDSSLSVLDMLDIFYLELPSELPEGLWPDRWSRVSVAKWFLETYGDKLQEFHKSRFPRKLANARK